MQIIKFILRQINGLFPFLYPLLHIFKNFNFLRGPIAYFQDLQRYKELNQKVKSPFSFQLWDSYPIYFDRYEEAGEIPRHYFHLDLWAAKKVYRSGVKTHYDIGSRLDSFISHCLVFCKVIMLDIRPLAYEVPHLDFIQSDCMNMKNIASNSLESLSTLHAFEHFGLGRYGDPIDPLGYQKAINEVKRVIKPGGNVYFATPIGRQRLEFNAHRIFDPRYIVELFKGLELIEFSAVDDQNKFIENANMLDFVNAEYSCGLFHFQKKTVKRSTRKK